LPNDHQPIGAGQILCGSLFSEPMRVVTVTAFDGETWEKHRVTSLECEELLFNRPLLVGIEEGTLAEAKRFYTLGETDGGRSLCVAFAMRARLIRAISPRDMSRKERGAYRPQ